MVNAWCAFVCCCDADGCEGCEDFVSVETERGAQIENEYERRFAEALEPVYAWLEEIRETMRRERA